jgi:SPP1 gp7 family putative phage head morphogenesis protein
MLAEPTAKKVRTWVTTAVKEGLTIDETVRGLVGTRTQSGILEQPRHAVRALVRTEATSAGNIAKRESYRSIGITHVRFLATLDARTTLQCASQDGQIFLIDEAPTPPLHINCRSVLVPVMNAESKPFGKRAAAGGQVLADVTFEEWIATQSIEDQNAVFGRSRAEAWRAGKLSLRDMMGRDLQPLTLAELRRLDRIGGSR